ncbi:hypothetical protein AAWM_07281 [Aspergillus awamori]|uniref:Uncharacterized protein n=1 Tax=Aspergillus awamori TaxID=105351 RepID=A0A401KYM8_ASPAW|nr:hypothetical protein AAWM_07281 [Aspergillus awamori]
MPLSYCMSPDTCPKQAESFDFSGSETPTLEGHPIRSRLTAFSSAPSFDGKRVASPFPCVHLNYGPSMQTCYYLKLVKEGYGLIVCPIVVRSALGHDHGTHPDAMEMAVAHK